MITENKKGHNNVLEMVSILNLVYFRLMRAENPFNRPLKILHIIQQAHIH